MDFENLTIRQHFLSQAEQRLNAMNPRAKPENQRIYRFRVLDREKFAVGPPRSVKIVGNLMIDDLFSFDRVGETRLRANFENLFRKYEKDVFRHTIALRKQRSRGRSTATREAQRLFLTKMLNVFRNPFNVGLQDFVWMRGVGGRGVWGSTATLEPCVTRTCTRGF